MPCDHYTPTTTPSVGVCALGLYGGTPSAGTCKICPRNTTGNEWPTIGKGADPPPIPREKWPVIVNAIAKLARSGDKGIGDTVQRITAKGGGEAFKRAYRRITGVECGCVSRQDNLNLIYPYIDGR